MQEAQARGQRLWPSFQGIAGAANKHAEMDLGPKWNNNPLTNTYSLMSTGNAQVPQSSISWAYLVQT